MIGINEVLLQ